MAKPTALKIFKVRLQFMLARQQEMSGNNKLCGKNIAFCKEHQMAVITPTILLHIACLSF
jgi:hypothetical protein